MEESAGHPVPIKEGGRHVPPLQHPDRLFEEGSMIIVIDGNFMANRAFHSVGHLTHNDIPTGVPFGMLAEAGWLVGRFSCDRIAWAFDKGTSVRCSVLPTYKHKRKPDPQGDPDKYAQRVAIHKAVVQMATDILPGLGYKNVWYSNHYEADDIIARFCMDHNTEPIIVVSSDADLYQLLYMPWVKIWNPASKVLWDADAFEEAKGIPPELWAEVKAITGCDTDDVPGVPGVGDKGAVEWILGTLKPTSVKAKAILAATELVEFNKGLVKLPWPGTPSFQYNDNDLTVEAWNALCDRLGFQRDSVAMPRLWEGFDCEIQKR
jgi:hypothetical protein